FFSCTGGHRDLHNNRHSFPTRRSSDLTKLDPDAAKKSTPAWAATARASIVRSEEHTSELQAPAVISYAVFCVKKKNITTFDAPGAGTGAGQGTLSFAISPRGEITGFYFDGTNAVRGFLRDEEGVITTFDVPGAGTGPGQGTFGGGFTPNGTIMGNYVDADDLSHGFVLDKNGVFATFDAPSAGTGPFQGTVPFG